jgi:hypothetical protein
MFVVKHKWVTNLFPLVANSRERGHGFDKCKDCRKDLF